VLTTVLTTAPQCAASDARAGICWIETFVFLRADGGLKSSMTIELITPGGWLHDGATRPYLHFNPTIPVGQQYNSALSANRHRLS
jgi:hypothetical protein